MWQNKEEDPGGSSNVEQLDNESLLANIKEVLKNSDQSNVTQEKVTEYINTITKAKAKRTRLKRDGSNTVSESSTLDANKKQRITLLRQQLEENKAKLAERGKNQKGIEEMVTQLKAQLNDSQQMMSPLNLSLAETKHDYTPNTPPQELYNILLVKERKITELTNKLQKQEGHLLDLQENLKEKDSVIDARTKAITLMSESLSKKGKSTLDALEETKEQMRVMQNNFVKLEEDMKARQLKLLDDLRSKNLEISDYQESIENLKMENERLGKIEQLEKQWQENKEVNELKEQIDALKKQLDDSNKSMIKAKAQYQKKLKEQNKKIEEFKKVSDSNALIVKLQTENSKLVEKIAELEEEKGNLQLNSMEPDIEKIVEEKKKLENDLAKLKIELNERVSNEMNSIQFEEQIERIEKEKSILEEKNRQLVEKIDDLSKQKQEISSKLDHYIQENMELVDKLEKLSAEKVSSAESIEIVEGLTQQELAAYQKTVETEKVEENDPPVELNESVLQLNEDSTELLQKIEMFNAERREVMGKLDELREENHNLSMKLKEIENNRDVLAEAYEQLQNEKEKLDDELKSDDLKVRYDNLLKEYDDLKRNIKEKDESISEKDLFELAEAKKLICQLQEQVKSNTEEIENYKMVIDENKDELINSSSLINNLQCKLKEKETEIVELNTVMSDLNTVINKLESENGKLTNFELLENQLAELKVALDGQLQQAQDYEQELDQNSNTISNLNKELINLNNKLLETEHSLEIKDDELKHLQNVIKDKDENFKKLKDQLEKRCEAVQKQISGNSETLDKRVEELTCKNKEQLEKMRKIAANLKKKTQEYQELQEKYNTEKEKWEIEMQEKNTSFLTQIKDMEDELTMKNQQIEELNEKLFKKHETTLEEELTGNVSKQFEDSKLELEMLIETKDGELQNYRDRINKLEETVDLLDNQRADFEKQVVDLSEKLANSMILIDDKTQFVNELESRLIILNEDLNNSKMNINDLSDDNNDLKRINNELNELNNKLNTKLSAVEDKVKLFNELQVKLDDLESLNVSLNEQITNLENINVNLQQENMKIKNELEKIEFDFQQQLEQLLNAKNELVVNCEKLQETKSSDNKEIERLNEEITNLRQELIIVRQARQTVDGVIEEAEKKILPTFQWETKIEPENASQQFFDQLNQQPEENSKEELLKKIKTLEFMLYNVEKDKNDALLQCHEMSNELTQLVYERENKYKSSIDDIQSQIVQQTVDVTDSDKQLQQIEFTAPSNEEIIEPQHAYVCGNSSEKEIESQIVSNFDANLFDNDLKHVEFTPTTSSNNESVCEQKNAYVCYKPGVGENDDGWGWSPEEAKLEEEHLTQSQNDLLTQQTVQLKEQVRVYEAERENHLEEIKQLQIKSGKLIKKCKELKQKNEHLEKNKNDINDFSNLDETIQDELKSQINQLEKKIKEISGELDKEKAEKPILLKKLENISAANERMLKEKEKQSMELINLQRKQQETVEKLEQFEWGGDDGFSQNKEKLLENQPNEDYAIKIEELNQTIKDLSLDNEELQNLLEEQRNLRIELEKKHNLNISVEEIQRKLEEKEKTIEELQTRLNNIQSNPEYLSMLEEKNQLEVKLNSLLVQFNEIQNSLTMKEKFIEELQSSLDNIEGNQQYLSLLEEKNQIEVKLNSLSMQFNEIQNSLMMKEKFIEELQSSLDNIEGNQQYLNLLEEKNQIEVKLNSLSIQFNEIQNSLMMKEKFIEELQSSLGNIEGNEQYLSLLEEKNQIALQFQEIQTNFVNKQKIIEELQSKIIVLENIEENPQYIMLLQEKHQLLAQQEEMQANNEKTVEKLRETEEKCVNLQSFCDDLQNRLQLIQQEIFDKDLLIGELQNGMKNDTNEKIQQLEDEIVNLIQEKQLISNELQKTQITQLTSDLNEFQSAELLKVQLTQKNQQIQELLKRNEELAQEWEMQVDQRGIDVAESWKIHLENVEANFNEIQTKLQHEINELEEKCNGLVNENNELRKNVDTEIRNEVDRLSDHQNYIVELTKSVQDKQNEIDELTSKIGILENYLKQLQSQLDEKDNKLTSMDLIIETTQKQFDEKREVVEEIVKLLEKNMTIPLSYDKQQIIDEFERQLNGNKDELVNLQQKIDSFKHKEIELTKLQQELTNHTLQLQNCEEKIMELETVNKNLNQIIHDKSNEINNLSEKLLLIKSNKDYDKLEKELIVTKEQYVQLQQTLTENQQQLTTINQYYTDKCTELDNVNYQMQLSQQNLQFLQTDLDNLKEMFNEKQQQLDTLLQQQEEQKNLLNSHEMASKQLTNEINNKNIELNSLMEQLKIKEDDYNSLQLRLDEETKQVADLKVIIEEQVLKIEELKKDLYSKSNDYDSLVAEMDIGKPTSVAKQSESQIVDKDGINNSMQAELDLALYVVHQLDVRCEELTMELTQLLEERDTLQLKLSNAIREKEELRKGGEMMAGTSGGQQVVQQQIVPNVEPVKQPDQHLQSKLTELKSIAYQKDKTFVDGKELRRLQQMTVMQHEAGKLPPEAAAKLVEASYTLSRDVQSPSKVLLNWLWGRSTPKQDEI